MASSLTADTPAASAPTTPAPTAPAEAAPSVDPSAEDDLTKIEGIGPKIAEHLKVNHIKTFAQLAATDPKKVHEIN